MVIVDRIKELASEKGIKLKFLAENLGVAHTYFADVKNGKNRISDERLIKIADMLDTTPAYLRGETDIKEKAESQERPDVKRLVEFDSPMGHQFKKALFCLTIQAF